MLRVMCLVSRIFRIIMHFLHHFPVLFFSAELLDHGEGAYNATAAGSTSSPTPATKVGCKGTDDMVHVCLHGETCNELGNHNKKDQVNELLVCVPADKLAGNKGQHVLQDDRICFSSSDSEDEMKKVEVCKAGEVCLASEDRLCSGIHGFLVVFVYQFYFVP